MIIPLYLLGSYTLAVRVFDFDGAHSAAPGSPLSSATLTNGQEKRLPDRFILCFSTKLSKVDGKNPFVIYGQNNAPWLAFGFWDSGTEVILWAEAQKAWGRFHAVLNPWTHVWKHVCADVDTINGNLSVSLGGEEPIFRRIDKLGTQKPEYISSKLVVGITNSSWDHRSDQFLGSIANINIYSVETNNSVECLSMKSSSKGDIFAWENMIFEMIGNGVIIEEVNLSNNPIQTRQIFLPMMLFWHDAVTYCKNLGNGWMTDISDQDDLNISIDMIQLLGESCKFLWIPVSDETVEGVFRNTNTGNLETYLPWSPSAPKNNDAENYVMLDIDEQEYYDVNANFMRCVTCTLQSTTIFKLKGLCENSYLGKAILLFPLN